MNRNSDGKGSKSCKCPGQGRFPGKEQQALGGLVRSGRTAGREQSEQVGAEVGLVTWTGTSVGKACDRKRGVLSRNRIGFTVLTAGEWGRAVPWAREAPWTRWVRLPDGLDVEGEEEGLPAPSQSPGYPGLRSQGRLPASVAADCSAGPCSWTSASHSEKHTVV